MLNLSSADSCDGNLIAFSLPSFAQGSSAAVSGLVTDPAGLVIVGAKIQATNVDTGVTYHDRNDRRRPLQLTKPSPCEVSNRCEYGRVREHGEGGHSAPRRGGGCHQFSAASRLSANHCYRVPEKRPL